MKGQARTTEPGLTDADSAPDHALCPLAGEEEDLTAISLGKWSDETRAALFQGNDPFVTAS